ncbi:MAG: helix-turn-helix transcriptional regulator [Saprospiraceae bacterium]|nr:helix-turn-helix transcriptional regulator [Saprospiraceae bacterium]
MISIALTLPVVLLAALIAQGVFAFLVLIFASSNKQANRFLALLLLSFSLWLVDSFYKASGLYGQLPNAYFQPIYYSFAFGPLIYFYVKSLTSESFRFQRKDWLHFIPVIIQAAFYWFLTSRNYEFKRWVWFEIHRPYTDRIEFDGTLLSLSIYLIFSIRLLFKYQSWLQNNFSEFSRISLHWLKITLSAMLVICIFWAIDVTLRDVFDVYRAHNFSEISMGFAILLLAFGGMQQGRIANIHFAERQQKNPETREVPDPVLLDQIIRRMEQQKDFLNPTLSLQEFAEALQLPARLVSTQINQGLHKSFVDFVNQYRVEEVQSKIQLGALDQYTLLALALDSGFNSKSTFNRVFKKQTGISPSEYINRSQNRN